MIKDRGNFTEKAMICPKPPPRWPDSNCKQNRGLRVRKRASGGGRENGGGRCRWYTRQ